MGIFNTIMNFTLSCPVCGHEISEFQTKDNDPSLSFVTFDSVDNFYSICDGCNSFIELYFCPDKERTIEDYKMRIIDIPVKS